MADRSKRVMINETTLKTALRDKLTLLNDTKISGFLVQIGTRGKPTYYFRYRSLVNDTRPKLKIGTYPAISPSDARLIAADYARQLALGIDPKSDRIARLEEARRNEAAATRERELELSRSVGGYFDRHYEAHLLRNKGGKDDVQRFQRHFTGWRGKNMTELDKHLVKRWQMRLEGSGLAHVTIKRSYAVIQAMLNHAVEEEFLSANPLKGVKLKRPPATEAENHSVGERRALEPWEITELHKGLERYNESKREARARSLQKKSNSHRADLSNLTYVDHVVPAILCIYYGGFRPGDVLGLEWTHLDRDVTIVNKVIEKIAHHDMGRMSFPLAGQLSQVLTTWRDQQGDPRKGPVFPSPRTGKRLSKGGLRKPWTRIKSLCDLPDDMDLYTLRHNFASQLIMAGADFLSVSKLMGHSDIETTIKNYGHIRQQHLSNTLNAIADTQGGPNITRPPNISKL